MKSMKYLNPILTIAIVVVAACTVTFSGCNSEEDAVECCDCPAIPNGLPAIYLCEDTPFGGSENPNGYVYAYEVLLDLNGLSSWQELRNELEAMNCECGSQ
jgi:hypothetical protein